MAGTVSVDMREIKRPVVAPSLLSAHPLRLESDVASLGSFAGWLHIDVMDGHFVPNMTYGPLLVRALERSFPDSVRDVHLMVTEPERFVEYFLPARPSYLVFHAEATPHAHRLLQHIRSSGCRAGLALNPGTPVSLVYPLLHMVDLVLVMSVNPGFGGQSFLPEVLGKVEDLYRRRTLEKLNFLIQIDGGVTSERAEMLVRKGCDVLVAGSAVFSGGSPEEAAQRIYAAALEGCCDA